MKLQVRVGTAARKGSVGTLAEQLAADISGLCIVSFPVLVEELPCKFVHTTMGYGVVLKLMGDNELSRVVSLSPCMSSRLATLDHLFPAVWC
jgi:hypothetical protein